MKKIEERLKQLLSNFEPFNYGNSDDEQRDAFVEGFKKALELPELKALENCLSKFCEFKPNGEIKRMVSSTNEAIFDINSVDRARITMDQWRNFIGEVDK